MEHLSFISSSPSHIRGILSYTSHWLLDIGHRELGARSKSGSYKVEMIEHCAAAWKHGMSPSRAELSLSTS